MVGAIVAAAACSTESSTDEPQLLSREKLLDPETCRACHADHVADWEGSMHAQAADDPVFIAMNQRAQRESNGQVGTFCVNCHAPLAVREGLTKDGLNLASIPAKMKGITCFYCHSVDAVEGTHDNPLRLAKDNVIRGPIANPMENKAHRSTYSVLHDRDKADSAAMCGSCHDIGAPPANIERTFSEWQESVFSHPGGATCGQCHMSQSASEHPIAAVEGAPARRFHRHTFAAVDVALHDAPAKDVQRAEIQSLLDSSLQSAVCVKDLGTSSEIRVIVDNVAAGHSFPSGSAPDRRLWAEVVATKGDQVLFKSGVVDGAIQAPDVTKLGDANMWLMRDCLFKEDGAYTPFLWEGKSFESRLLPAQITFDPLDPRFYQTHIVRYFPRTGQIDGVPDKVTLRMRLQTIGHDMLNELVASGDLDANLANQVPTFDVGKMVEWTKETAEGSRYFEGPIPVTCVTLTNLNIAAQKFDAPAPVKCSP